MKKQMKQLILFLCTLVFIGNISLVAADTASDTDTLLNWAENNYPTYFPTHQTTQSIAPWLFRFYPETNVYAGVNTNDKGVYVFGGPWGNVSPTYIDSLSNLLVTANNGKLTNVRTIVTGSQTFVIKADGTVWGWGNNIYGQLGDGTKVARSAPVKVIGLTDVTNIVSGANATIALKNDGTVWAWGSNFQGEFGNGTGGFAEVQYTPAKINGLADVTTIGGSNNSGFYAIKVDGTLWTWGCQASKIIDYSSLTFACPTLESPLPPTQISGFSDVVDFQSRTTASMLDSFYVLESEGVAWAWGNNFLGQLGNGTNSNKISPHGVTGTDRDTPEQVAGLTGIKNIASVNTTSGIAVFAFKKDGTVWAWGDNSNNQLGSELTTVTVDKPTQMIQLTDSTKISANIFHSLALKNDGTVWAWGWNNLSGAIGVGTGAPMEMFTPIPKPVQLVGLSNIVDIHASAATSYALKGDGTIWGWGRGLLKSGVESERYPNPIQICNLPGITNIVPGSASSLYLLRNDGTVWNAYFDGCTQL